jgi:hypothetical protein
MPGLAQMATEVLMLYGLEALDYTRLQEEVRRPRLLAVLERQQEELQTDTVQPLYHQLDPAVTWKHCTASQEGRSVYASFIGQADRFVTTATSEVGMAWC